MESQDISRIPYLASDGKQPSARCSGGYTGGDGDLPHSQSIRGFPEWAIKSLLRTSSSPRQQPSGPREIRTHDLASQEHVS